MAEAPAIVSLIASATKDAVDLVMMAITLLDGMRAVGLDTGREAHRVEQILQRIEKGPPPDPSHEE